MRPIQVLMLGDHTHREFQEACAWLADHTELRCGNDWLVELARLSQAVPPPHVIVIAQSRPGQFSHALVQRLHTAAPLSRLVALLGSWCEGEIRSGQPWPGVIRVFWHQWMPRLANQIERLRQRGDSVWSLPRTATDAEQLMHATAEPLHQRQGLIAIAADDLTTYDTLGDVCRAAGYSTAWLTPHQPPFVQGAIAAIWNSRYVDPQALRQLEKLVNAMQPTPVLALLDFPRWDDAQTARAAGAAAILSKPLMLDDLYWQLDRLTTSE